MKSFRSNLIRPKGTGTWTYASVPFNIIKAFNTNSGFRVKGEINGIPYNSFLMPRGGGEFILVVNKQIRDKIQKSAGDTVLVTIEKDDKKPQVLLPKEFKLSLAKNIKAKEKFNKLSFYRKKRYTSFIASAKKEETKEKRIKKVIKELLS